MTYYAVTDDPNELLHYGVKGMKWGQHIFGGRQRSAAYRRASGKLSRGMRYGIASKTAHWRRSPSPAVLRAKAKAKEERREARAAKKEQKFMTKAIQQAREGRLKYGKLTDAQVQRVTERLQMEQRARQLGSTEKPKFKRRMKEAIQEGMIRGATQGGAAYIEERMRAKGRFEAQRKYGLKQAKAEARSQNKKNREIEKANRKADNKYAKEEAKIEQKKALYKEAYENGGHVPSTYKGLQKQHTKLKEQRKLEETNKSRLENDRRLREDIYKKYVLGNKNDSADSVYRRFNDTKARESFLNPSYEKNEIARKARAAVKVHRKNKRKTRVASLRRGIAGTMNFEDINRTR